MAAPVDRVQLLKQEATANGGADADSNDAFPAQLDPNEDAPELQGFFLQPPSPSTSRDELVWAKRDASGNMVFRDDVDQTERTLSELLAGTGLTESQHEALDSLVHAINETSYVEVTRSSGQISNVTVWDSASKTTKIRETQITRSAGRVSQLVIIQYDGAGTEEHRLTRVLTRTAGQISSITNTKA